MSFSFAGKFPAKRPRRMRRDEFSRRMMRETQLTAADFIYPVFVLDGASVRTGTRGTIWIADVGVYR